MQTFIAITITLFTSYRGRAVVLLIASVTKVLDLYFFLGGVVWATWKFLCAECLTRRDSTPLSVMFA